MSPCLQPALPAAPLPQHTSGLCSCCSVTGGRAQMQMGLYVAEIKGLVAWLVAAGLGCNKGTLRRVQSTPSAADPRLACSAQPLPGPACLSRQCSPKMPLFRPSVPVTLSNPTEDGAATGTMKSKQIRQQPNSKAQVTESRISQVFSPWLVDAQLVTVLPWMPLTPAISGGHEEATS